MGNELSEYDEIGEDVLADMNAMAAFYGQMEIPDSEPVGWVFDIKAGSVFDWDNNNQSFMKPEVQEWCDTNLLDKYWVFNPHEDLMRLNFTRRRDDFFVQFNFTTERDYVLFKMFWQ